MPRNLVLLLLAVAAPLAAQSKSDADGDRFTWNGTIADGSWVRIQNLNGGVDVSASADGQTHVLGEKRWTRGDPSRVHFVVEKDGGNVTICALWNPDETRCSQRSGHDHGDHHDRNGDVSVHFTVSLPAGVKVDAATVNGGVGVRDVRSEVRANTVNGAVSVQSASGPVNASTINGSLRVRVDALQNAGDMRLSTVNGSAVLEVPASLDADVEMGTTNGRIETDFPMTVTGRIDPRHLRTTLGKGGRRLELETTNGDVELRKAGGR